MTLLVKVKENKSEIIEFKDGTLLRKRSRQKVLRYNKVSENEKKEEHYRQLLMLFTSWRNKEFDLMNKCNSFYESYHKMEDVIFLNQQKYEKIDQQLLETAITEYSEDFENSIRDPVLPQIDHQELIDNIEAHHPSRTYGCFDPSVNEVSNSCEQPCSYDLGLDIGITRKQLDDSCLPLNDLSDDAFRTLAQNLNIKQKRIFLPCISLVEDRD